MVSIVQDYLNRLGREKGAGSLLLDAEGRCTLVFSDDVELFLAVDGISERLTMRSYLANLALDPGEVLAPLLMRRNLDLRRSLPFSFAIDDGRAFYCMVCTLEANALDYWGFIGALEAFAQATRDWAGRIDAALTHVSSRALPKRPSPRDEAGPTELLFRA